ncbi:MAG: phytanoyl-CoA dioxygenase family protein [Bacteroidota bacterium]
MRHEPTYPLFTLSTELTADQVGFFEKNGFLHFENFISQETVQLLIQASQEVQKQWLAQDVKKVNGVPIKYGFDVDGSRIVQRFAFASLFSPFLQEFLKDDRIQALLPLMNEEDARIGEYENDGIVINHYINNKSSEFTKMGWHTDSPRDIFHGKKIKPMLNVGICLDDSPSSNGGLRLIPGSHNQGLRSLFFRKKYYVDNDPDINEVALEAKAGDLTVHDGRLWHRVAQSPVVGAASRRRVIYVPLISGEYKPKDANSPTAFYQRFLKLVK